MFLPVVRSVFSICRHLHYFTPIEFLNALPSSASRFIQQLKENETLLKNVFKSKRTSGSRLFSQMKFRPAFEENYIRPVFRVYNAPYGKATVLLSGLLSFFGLGERPPEEPELIMKIKWGILHMKRGEFDKAEAVLHEALKLAQDEKDEDGITYVYDILANLTFETGQYLKAEKLFVNVLQRLFAKGEQQDSNKVIEISLKLAKILQASQEFKKAELGYTFCIETLDKKLESENPDEDTLALWGMSMDWYARFLLTTNRKNEALNCFKKAYDMCVRVNGVEHEQTVILLNDLGTVSSMIGDNETAMSYFEKARDIGNKIPGMKDLASVYINLGQLYLLREMYNESKTACEEGYKKARSFEDPVAVSEAQECLKSINEVLQSSEKGKQFKLIDSERSGFKTAKLIT